MSIPDLTEMKHDFRIVQNCPVGMLQAPFISIIATDAKATVNSIYRGTDAESILNAHGKHSQAQLYQMFLNGVGAPANPPGFSTHEQKSDGVAYSHIPRGHDLAWWQVGFDVNDSDVINCMRIAGRYGWHLFRPYPSGVEFHHLNFMVEPQPGNQVDRVNRLRETLPRH
jgi:hypothetical protein